MPYSTIPKSDIEGFYYFLAPPKAIKKPQSLIGKKNDAEEDLKENILRCTSSKFDYSSRRSSRSKRLSQIWNQKEDFYQVEEVNQILNSQITKAALKDIEVNRSETINKDETRDKTFQQKSQQNLEETNSEGILKRITNDLINDTPTVPKNVDVGIQFPEEMFMEVESRAYRIVSSALESALVNLLTSNIPQKQNQGFEDEDSSLLAIRTLSENYVEGNISTLCQLFLQNGLIQCNNQNKFEQEVDLAAIRLEKLCQKLDDL